MNEQKKDPAHLEPAGTDFTGAALKILEQEGPMTFRQLFWRLVSAEAIHNDVESYEQAGRVMTKLREDGRCPSRWIVDESRATLTIDGN